MTKFKLEMEYDYDFDLIGISCHAPDYRLCWALNQALNIALHKREEKHILSDKKKGTQDEFAVYEFFSEEDHVEYFLLPNKGTSGLLVPEQKAADYFLLLKNNFALETSGLIALLKRIDMVIAAFAIEAETLKSRENLLF
jgi:hypothetical protein